MSKDTSHSTAITRVGAIILAAGNSSRMGSCKFLLPMSDGTPFFKHIVQTFSNYGINNIVVVTHPTKMDLLHDLCEGMVTLPSFAINRFPERERFYSLQLGLSALKNVDFTFIHNADGPFIDAATLHSLFLNRNAADYISGIYNNKGGHPILINKTAIKYLLSCPQDAVLNEELKSFSRCNVPVKNKRIVVDINTPGDYHHYFINHGA